MFFFNTLLKVDEAEIFEGGENKLTMTQAYTWEFQCEYKLQKYPFDTQVTGNSDPDLKRQVFSVSDKDYLGLSGMCNQDDC